MRYLGLIVMAFGCSQDKSLSDVEVQDSDDQLLGDSNVFLDDPTIEMGAADQSEAPIDTAAGDTASSAPDVLSGILLQQQSSELLVQHFGVALPCDWSTNDILIGYYTENLAVPYTGAFMVDYGGEGSCVTNIEYTIDLYPLSGVLTPGLHLFYAANSQVIIDLQSF